MNRYVAAGIEEGAVQLPPSFEAFQAEALAAGCDEALVREWQPNAVLGTHSHLFDAEAIVVRGEMWLTEGGRTWHLTPGATFRLAAGTLHGERYGLEGATYWVGRRQVPAQC
ncbi:MAG: AraC family transcriptional regulator [Rhizobacter sp.]|nr:AraC family transcriptional regulator [Rhizobacter sp.]